MNTMQALNRLTKWRMFFAGMQLGTRSDTDIECKAIRDHREVTILLRAEVNAVTALLLAKGVFTREEWDRTLGIEAVQLEKDYQDRYPGVRASDDGLVFDQRAIGTMKGWKP